MSIDSIIEQTIGVEGGYSNHPDDAGGPTRWGITQAVARRHGYAGDMRLLPRATAVQIYRDEFFVDPGFARVAAVSEAVARELFDTGVNMGPAVPALWFQQWLNALNDGGRLYPDIVEDAGNPGGGIGPKTLSAFQALIRTRGKADAERVVLLGLNSDQGARYKQLARARAANESFVFGWLKNRVGLA